LLCLALAWGKATADLVVPAAVQPFLQAAQAAYTEAEAAHKQAIPGKEHWLFFAPELRHLTVGTFWGAAAPKVSKAKAEYADPLPAILDFADQLKRAGIQLLFMPVPAKSAVYPEKFSEEAPKAKPGHLPPRVDVYDAAFLKLLKQKGVQVLDLQQAFMKVRVKGEPLPFYCKSDTHWSSAGCAEAARLILEATKRNAWLKDVPRHTYKVTQQSFSFAGDLEKMRHPDKPVPEQLTLLKVSEGGQPVQDWRQSPILLVGDSHTLIFHSGGDMHAVGAGLADHLAARFGFPMDVVGVRGSGATPCRVNLLRRGDNLAGKRLVIWCLSVREFTEGNGWMKVPVIR